MKRTRQLKEYKVVVEIWVDAKDFVEAKAIAQRHCRVKFGGKVWAMEIVRTALVRHFRRVPIRLNVEGTHGVV